MTAELAEKIILLQQKLETHIDDFNEHKNEEDGRWRRMLEATEANTACVHELTLTVTKLSISTQGIVEAWQAGSTLGKLVKWLSGFGVAIALNAAWFKNWI